MITVAAMLIMLVKVRVLKKDLTTHGRIPFDWKISFSEKSYYLDDFDISAEVILIIWN